ncbi:MAG: hypothetical protein H8D63_00315 [Parcubacteria group bacterium]|nr:hypothetical protein [Parcubacteria group bacterium]
MNKIIPIIIFALLFGFGVYVYVFNEYGTQEENEHPTEEEPSPFVLLQNTMITAPGTDVSVRLVNGVGSYEIVPGSASQGVVRVLDDVFAIRKEGDRTDMAVILVSDSGGSGVFYYLALFNVVGGEVQKTSESFLGDRIVVEGIGVGELVHGPDAEYRLSVRTFVRKKAEPMASEPTVSNIRTFYVTNQVLEEVEVGKDDT